MINLAQKSADEAAEICLRGELSSAGRTGGIAPEEGGRFGDEIIHLMRLKPADRVQTRAAQRIEASLRYMMQNLNQPMKVPVLSAMVGLSESSFFALFKSATGLTPLDFFIRARMRRAGELLAETTLQIKEVAARLGYDDQFYFSRLFKSVHGVAPREYRARQQQVTHRSGPETMAEEPSPEPGLASAHPSIAPKTYPLTLPNRYLGSQSQPSMSRSFMTNSKTPQPK